MEDTKEASVDESDQQLSRSRDANWPAVLFFIHVHLLSLYGLWLLVYEVKYVTLFFCEY